MELNDAPRGPCCDDGAQRVDKDVSSFQTSINDSSMEAILDSIVGGLVLPQPLDHKSLSCGLFFPFQESVDKLHKEVQFCIWSMNIALSVYMQLLNLVDISVRMEISNVISQYLSEWRGDRDPSLFDSLDKLIKSEFMKHALTDIPDMDHLKRNKNSHILCSTVACYIKDIAINLDAVNQCDIESTIDVIFPPSKNFIGRCFFPRLASVSSELLELIKSSVYSECELSSDSMNSTNSTLFSGSAENSTSATQSREIQAQFQAGFQAGFQTQLQSQFQTQIQTQIQAQIQTQVQTQVQSRTSHFRIS